MLSFTNTDDTAAVSGRKNFRGSQFVKRMI